MKDKEKLSQEQKKLEEAVYEKENNQDQDPFGNIFGFFGDDKGTLIEEKMQTALNTYNEAEKSSQHISETVDDTTDDVKKHFG